MVSRRPSHADSARLALFPLAVTILLLGLFLALAAGTAFGQSAPSAGARAVALGEEMEVQGVLEVLYNKGELPVCEVQRRILVESSSTTYVVDKLCDRGLVRRRPSAEDRRVTLLDLTPAGRRLIARIFPPHAAAMRHAVGGLPPRERAQAIRLLRTLGKGAAERVNG